MKLKPNQQERIAFINEVITGICNQGEELTPHLRQLLDRYVSGEINIKNLYPFLKDSAS